MTDTRTVAQELVVQREEAGLTQQYTNEDGKEAMRLTPAGEKVARQLTMLGEAGQDELMEARDGVCSSPHAGTRSSARLRARTPLPRCGSAALEPRSLNLTRRGALEGSIYRRKDGRWVGAVHAGYRDGKRRRRVVYGSTRREVQAKMAALVAKGHQNLPIVSETQTVEAYLTGWLASISTSVRPRTHESYSDIVRLHIVPSLGQERLSSLSPQHVQMLINDRLECGLSPRTVQYVHAVLRRALGQATRWGILPRNVAALVPAPRVRRPEIRPLDPQQARQLLRFLRGDRLEALVTVALAVGLRQGEALGLRWMDVDLEAGELRVRHSLQRVNGEPILVEPKTERSRRTIQLPAVVTAALRAHRKRQLEERLVAGSRWQDTGHVFTTTIGTPLHSRPTTQRFQAILKEAGLPRQRFHDLRHACASFLLAQGVQPRVVMETLGHSQVSTTMDIYGHVMPSMQRDAADRMDALLEDVGGH